MSHRTRYSRRTPDSRPGWAATVAIVAAALVSSEPAAAANHVYALELLDRLPLTYRLELPVQHPGTLTVEAEWSGPRMLSLRVDSPDGKTVRRAGRSPLRLEFDVESAEPGGSPWLLSVHAVPTSGNGEGLLTITLPELPGPEAIPPSPPVGIATSETAAPEPWEQPRRAPADLSGEAARAFETTERFRSIVVGSEAGASADGCGWQNDLLRYLAEMRDRAIDRQGRVDTATIDLLERIVAAIERVEALRTSLDPALGGPPPARGDLYEAWLRTRRERMQQIEGELDRLFETIQRGHVPELESYVWPARMVTCLAACQRHFEERGRLGEERAVNRDLAQAQWDVFLSAREALLVLTSGDGAPDTHYTRSR